MQKIDTTYQEDDYLMNFVTNHDENSWNGTVEERMGDAAETMLALTYTLPGIPLIYSGQEYDMNKRLRFFEKDTISKEKGKVWPVLEKLGSLKSSNIALHGAKNAANYEEIKTSAEDKILAFRRSQKGAELIYIANMSDENIDFSIEVEGKFVDYMTGEKKELTAGKNMKFDPWQYIILVNR